MAAQSMMRFSFSVREMNKFDVPKFHNISQSELVHKRTKKRTQTGRQADRQTSKQADRQTGRQADRQIGREAERQRGR